MKTNRHYWQLILFVAVLMIPSVFVAVQGWRMVRLEAEKSAAEARSRALVEISRDIWDRLENIKFQEMGGGEAGDPAVAFVAWVEGDRLAMPWETDPNAERSRRAIDEDPEFSRRIVEAERAEFAERRLDRAEDVYRELVQTATNDHQRVLARLKLAAVLRRSGRPSAQAESDGIYRDLLSLPAELVDDEGLSFASTAALGLISKAGSDVVARAARAAEFPAALTLGQAYRWRLVLTSLLKEPGDASLRADAEGTVSKLSDHIGELEKSQDKWESNPEFQQLRLAFPTLSVNEKAWLPGEGSLVLSRASGASGRPLVIAVHREKIVEAVRASRTSGPAFDIVFGGTGLSLDEEHLPGLKVSFAAGGGVPGEVDLRRNLYFPAILLVLSVNLFGGYLLWRDTQREVRLAELRSQFVASVSHELKTPLTAIRMFGEILQSGNPVDRQTHEECVDTIVNESERLTRLLNNVLDFSRIEHGQKSYRLAPTQLSEVVSAAAKTMQYPLAEQGFDLHMEIDERTPPVDGDSDALKQAVLNLLTNAMKYSGKSREIGLRLFPENGDALIQVSDHGIGIPELEKSRIFEKFYRAHVRENQSISGTGLGLALVAHIVQGHGGSVQVESCVGMGSTFSIRLPIHAGGTQ